ncbi:hypothetical protein ACFL1S_08630, partial [Pseudomonadota bacterium]
MNRDVHEYDMEVPLIAWKVRSRQVVARCSPAIYARILAPSNDGYECAPWKGGVSQWVRDPPG